MTDKQIAVSTPATRRPCPACNDEGVVCTHEGDIIGPCECMEPDPDLQSAVDSVARGSRDEGVILTGDECRALETWLQVVGLPWTDWRNGTTPPTGRESRESVLPPRNSE